MNFSDNHNRLFLAAFSLFAVLTLFVAIVPALENDKNNAPLPGAPTLSEEAEKGKAIYISNGCVACHTQQVRNVDMDRVWGTRPGIPADYAAIKRTDFWRNTATLMGTERTGPDLTNAGVRQPGREWNLVHLFNPRIVVGSSVMPSYPWLFEFKEQAAEGDVEVALPDEHSRPGHVLVAKKEALYLVAYLQSLKQAPLPDGTEDPVFLYKKEAPVQAEAAGGDVPQADGKALYAMHCQACHQENGEGLKGAFPPLKGSPVVQDQDPELMLRIIMQGYDAHPEYASMPPVGANSQLTADEIAAIMNHERTSWGNNAPKVTTRDIEALLSKLAEDNKE